MRILTIVALLTGSMLAGCVTEGVIPNEPASDEEAAQANLALGIGYIQEGRPDFAIDVLSRALELEPRLADAHGAIALAYDQIGDSDLAESHHRRATQLAPSNGGLQNSFAVFLCRQDRWEEAKPYFERAIARAGNAPPVQAMLNAGKCALAAGDTESAETQFRAVLQIQENVEALRSMMDVSIRAANYRSGRAFWQRLERSSQIVAADLVACYQIESELGDAGAARQCADRLRREFPGSAEVARLRELERNAG